MLHGFLFTAFSLGIHLVVLVVAGLVPLWKQVFAMARRTRPIALPAPSAAQNNLVPIPIPAVQNAAILLQDMRPLLTPPSQQRAISIITCTKDNCNHAQNLDCNLLSSLKTYQAEPESSPPKLIPNPLVYP
jgi:hypothetical protein